MIPRKEFPVKREIRDFNFCSNKRTKEQKNKKENKGMKKQNKIKKNKKIKKNTKTKKNKRHKNKTNNKAKDKQTNNGHSTFYNNKRTAGVPSEEKSLGTRLKLTKQTQAIISQRTKKLNK